MSTPNYTKDYNPLRITDLWKYERPRDINRESKPSGKPSSNSIAITLYDSVEDTYIEAKSMYAMSKKIACSQSSLSKLYNNSANSVVGLRYFLSKDDFIKSQEKDIHIFDSYIDGFISFSNITDAANHIGVNNKVVSRLISNQQKSIQSRYFRNKTDYLKYKKESIKIWDSVDKIMLEFENYYYASVALNVGVTAIKRLLKRDINTVSHRYTRSQEDAVLYIKSGVMILDSVNNSILEFQNSTEASKKLQIPLVSISKLIRGKTKVLAGRYTLVK